MKIAIDCRLWNQGGVGRYIRNLVYYLQKLDQQNQYTLFFFEKALIKADANFQVKITRAKWHTVAEQWQFCQELNQGLFDLVHFPYFSHPIFYQRPFVITVHDLTIKHMATGKATTQLWPVYWLKRAGYSLALKHAIEQSNHILVPSRFVKEDVLKQFAIPENKLSVTYEGLGIEFEKIKAKPLALGFDRFLLYVGNFYPHKNVLFMLRALFKLKTCGLALVMVGPQDYFSRKMQQEVQRLGLTETVKFCFETSESELVWLYRQAQALVLPSLFEGFGLPIVEAANYQCPLLLSDIAVFREIAPPAALFFDPRNLADLEQKLLSVKKRINVQAPASYFKQFSFARLAQQTLAVYHKQKT
ncbi:hypothetical protein A2459_01050 [Candidatus Roizmanbacteria bacterium RIFOXYC2_FULL_41_10]|nr:MAG: hypothetical protein A2377_01200 [Candidatus Roizmanbacteria bacterium RIFOXYB1_FULL_41_27]OGK73125.1 MAG: hypothetical protein A2459_01050 [Candidatus Roizmanbacteria bacterium RIFOXYC2_FULL_41_10]